MPIPTPDRKGIVDQPIEIFRTGRHTPMEGAAILFSEADLAGMVAAYDPALHRAPIVIGHPATDAPAYGWVDGLAVSGDRLQAKPAELDPAFVEIVRAGRYRTVSAAFYPPDSPHNPKPGAYYLRHVGFLGAHPPAVKGLRPVSFAGGDEGVLVFAEGWAMGVLARVLRGLRETWIARFGQEDADKALPSWEIDRLQEQAAIDQHRDAAESRPAFTEPPQRTESPEVTTQNGGGAQPSAREKELEQQLEAERAKTAAFAEGERKRRQADDAAFLADLERQGRLLPANRPLAAGLLARLDGGEAVSFAEGRAAETPRDALRALLAAQPRAVEFAELAGSDGGRPLGDDPHALATAAVAFQEAEAKAGRQVTTAQAVAHVRANQGARA